MQQIRNNMNNGTSVSEFLLMKISDTRQLQLVHFYVFLILYLIALTANLLVIAAIALDKRLHNAMYFFLMNLASLDIGTISVTVPKSMGNSITNSQLISYSGCVAQVFFFVFFEASGFAILTIMAYDRYVAICNPLRYEIIMNPTACIRMAARAWFAGLLYSAIHTSTTFAITFCSNIVHQFFCDIPKIHILSCSDNYLVEVKVLAFSVTVVFLCLVFIFVSYVQIFAAVLRMPSVQGRQKAFSTCIPHLVVVSLLIFSGAIAYMSPSTHSPSKLDLVFAVLYAVVPPVINPFIYSMRNKEIKIALWKFFSLKDFLKVPHVRFVS